MEDTDVANAPWIHDFINLESARILDLKSPQRSAMASLINSLLADHRGSRLLHVNFLKLTVVKDTPIRRCFLELVNAVVELDKIGKPEHDAAGIILAFLRDAATVCPAQAFFMGHNTKLVKQSLGGILRAVHALDRENPAMLTVIEANKSSYKLPFRFQECYDVLLRCSVTQDSRIPLLEGFRAISEFMLAACDRVLFSEQHLNSPLNPARVRVTAGNTAYSAKKRAKHNVAEAGGCDGCDECNGGADNQGLFFEVDLRRRPVAPSGTPSALDARNVLDAALVRYSSDREIDAFPGDLICVENYGSSVVRVRGAWNGPQGHAAAKVFAQYAVKVVYKHLVELKLGLDAIALEESLTISDEPFNNDPFDFYEANVGIDSERSNLTLPQNMQLSYFGEGPVFRLNKCRFHGKKSEDTIAGDVARCRKASDLRPRCRLGPGMMVFVCPHRVVYGYTVMDKFESPRYIFEALRQYFPFPPEEIIYDLACSLHRYCLARNPSFFKDCRFYLDRFHEMNHTACSWSYKSPNDGRHFVNSQVLFVCRREGP